MREGSESPEMRLLLEDEAFRMLEAYGIPVPAHALAKTKEEAVAMAVQIGFPVVMKVISPQIPHKSDAGGVVLGIASPGEVGEAWDRIHGNVAQRAPGAEIKGLIVEKELVPGLELIVGGRRDPSFGPLVSIGLGGTLVEVLRDVATELLPVGDGEVRHMIRSLRGYPLIAGYRGRGALDEAGLVRVVLGAARMLSERPEIMEFDINPLVLYSSGACAADARILSRTYQSQIAESAPPAAEEVWIHPRTIAVVGASGDPKKLGYVIFRNLLRFPGRLYPVNPNRSEVLGLPAYPSLLSVPEEVDMAVIAVPSKAVPQVMEEAGKRGVKLTVVISAGFRESGEEGRRLEEEITATARRHGMRLLGPNCLGIILPHRGINATFEPLAPRPGGIAFVSQSGATIATVIDWSIPRGMGFSAIVSLGNQADLGFEEFLKYLATDPATKAIILYIEEIRDGKRFLQTVSGITPEKPVVAIKSGSSRRGREVAVTHTGSLAGSFEVYMAAFRRAGVIPVQSLRKAFYLAELLAAEGYPRGTRALVITSAGGFAVLASDYAERYGVQMIELPPDVIGELDPLLPPAWNRQNPMDIVGDAGADRYARIFDVMIRHQDLWDIAFVIGIPSATLDPNHLAQEIVRFSRHTGKMIVGCLLGGDSVRSGIGVLRDHDIPNFEDLQDAFMAVGTVCAWMDRRGRRSEPEE